MYVFFDIGGTNTRIGISHTGEALDEQYMFETVQEFDSGIEYLLTKTKEYTKGSKIDTIVAGLPGTLSDEKNSLTHAPHLEGWVDKDIKKILTDTFDCEVYFENDASLVGLGEAMHGAGKGNSIVVYITVSTGVGGTRIVDGRIDLSRHGFEIGHHHVKDDKTLEELVSGTVIGEKYGKHPRDILEEDVWEKYTDDLALGVSNAVLFWSPDIVVIGGSMARSVLFDRLNQKLKEDTQILERLPNVVHATLDTVGGLYGGLAYCQNLDRQKKSL